MFFSSKIRVQFFFFKSAPPPKYKYLGIYLDQHLSFDDCTTVLSDAAGRALGGVINKFKEMKDMGFETFEKMYETGYEMGGPLLRT